MNQRLRSLLADTIAAAIAGCLGYSLATYDVPLSLNLACSLALFVTFHNTLREITQASRTVTHGPPASRSAWSTRPSLVGARGL
ncbi:hypothetical protein [Streptomyces javensis]|uniref:Uncharacterized protein n=1 Tax=Streptomyces javensis TaxID=114698 RepID=A0ABS0RQI5_9ACTN|nr:hypothetical protein [Streptomyces javensis]MBI0319671.1 hypothetical protein [Streptomyces javensis]